MSTAADDDDEFMPWEDWLQLSEAEQDRLFQIECRKANEAWDRLTPKQQYQHRRSTILRTCLQQRRLVKEFSFMAFMKERLKASQRRLLEIRAQRQHGFVGRA